MSLLGTAREALENSRYDRLVKKYGESVAEILISQQLQDRDIKIEEFRTYKKVKRVIQNDGLNVKEAQKEAEELADGAIDEVLI